LPVEIIGDKHILAELGNRKRIDILEYVCENGWCSSSNVAKNVGLHIGIVSQFLNVCFEYGLMERRFVRGRRRGYYEYRLKDKKIQININLEKTSLQERIEFLRKLLAYCERVFGVSRTDAQIKSAVERDVLRCIETGKCNMLSRKIDEAEKLIVSKIEEVAGTASAKLIVEKIRKEVNG
jgi:DNA-binding transcriptional ArsR family regulator